MSALRQETSQAIHDDGGRSRPTVLRGLLSGVLAGIAIALMVATPAAAATVQYANGVVRGPYSAITTGVGFSIKGGTTTASQVNAVYQTYKISTAYPYDAYSVFTAAAYYSVDPGHATISGAGSRCYQYPYGASAPSSVALYCWSKRP